MNYRLGAKEVALNALQATKLMGDQTPRRGAMRAIGVAGAWLLAALSLGGVAQARAKRAKAAGRGKRGKQGPQGPAGPRGPAGPTTIAGFSVRTAETNDLIDVPSMDEETSSFGCNADELLIGCGYQVSLMGPECHVKELILLNGQCHVTVFCDTGGTATDLGVIAFCLSA